MDKVWQKQALGHTDNYSGNCWWLSHLVCSSQSEIFVESIPEGSVEPIKLHQQL